MPLLIDGHNLIGQLPGLSLEDPNDEEALVRYLMSYRARTQKAITVVFDRGEPAALPRSRRRGGVEVVFAGLGGSADALIIRRVQRSRNPQEWLVVTSDNSLKSAVTQLGARVRSAGAFARDLAAIREAPARANEREEPTLSTAEVEAWLKLFEEKD